MLHISLEDALTELEHQYAEQLANDAAPEVLRHIWSLIGEYRQALNAPSCVGEMQREASRWLMSL